MKGEKRNLVRIHFFANACHVCRAYGKNIELKRCSSCKSIAYCNQEHQKAHWLKHKELCKILSDIIKVNGTLHEPLGDFEKNPKSWVKAKEKLITLVESKLGRELMLFECEMLEFPRSCEICHETDSIKLRDCKECPDASFCTKHPRDDRHSAKCKTSNLCFAMHTTTFPVGIGLLACMAIGSHHEEKIPKNMEEAMKLFLIHCPVNKTDASSKLWMNPKEVYPMNAWQTVLHHIPSLKVLKIVFVGPKRSSDPEELDLCVDCNNLKRKLIVQEVGDSYLDFITAKSFTKPDYVIGFHLQMCHDIRQHDHWTCTFKELKKLGCPFSVTSSSTIEFEGQRTAIDIFFEKEVKYTWAGRNPMASLSPHRHIEDNDFWFPNQWMTIYKKLD
ncbi:uncharacterized protein [Venturia canescens]|uniref:uncharacterized protein n=1 Tax=Venturia canescens TaxID=32260 RepID=UPI001C9C9202|nr:uncharacterized protein LOC122407941 [Venturia canescens]